MQYSARITVPQGSQGPGTSALLPDGDQGRLKVFFSDVISGGETQVFERRDVSEDAIFVCSDTPSGIYELNGVILDGRGGKLPFDLKVEVATEQTSGGSIALLTT